ncbi:Ankyrin-3 [Symbiodinium microadriaticum]|uniref:Ankyrin-3 n=1 Tax=Symbiodinium microadriaticum TaxID=2951 RepID=A0A1Q9DH12_SYMMI|nr:Ankyrin-3 [Symbiodinium microadriaticum]
MKARPAFAFTPASRKQDDAMGCCASQTVADALQPLAGQEDAAKISKEVPSTCASHAEFTPTGAAGGYDASPPQPLLPGEAVGEVELPDKDTSEDLDCDGPELQEKPPEVSPAAASPMDEVHEDRSWHESAASGDVPTLAWHLTQAAESSQRLQDGTKEDRATALHLAASGGHVHACAWLLRAAADPAALTKTKATPLHLAAHGGHLDVAKLLLEPELFDIQCSDTWPDVSSTDLWRCTPLHRAAETGATEVALFLLEKRASAEKADREGNTPLHKAAYSGSGPLVQLLTKQAKVQLDFTNNDGFSPLDICVREKRSAAGDVLVSAGAKLVKDVRKSPPTLLTAACSGLPFLCSYMLKADLRTVKKQLGEVDDAGRSPLLVAASRGDAAVVERLLEHPSCLEQLETPAKGGLTPLHAAAAAGSRDVLAVLLARSASLQLPDGTGTSALGHAAGAGQVELMHWLVENGLEPDSRNDSERTALHLAAASGQVSACEALLQTAKEPQQLLQAQDWEGATAAHMAVRGGHASVCRLLGAQRADLQADLDFGVTPLQIAAEAGHQEVLQLLLEDMAGDAHPDALHTALTKGRVSDGRTPWLLAAAEGHVAGCERLWAASKACRSLDLPSSRDRAGRTAMILAAKGGHLDVCVWLMQSGCSPDGLRERDACSWTPLHAASAEGQKPVVEWLLEQGADLRAVDEDGRTAREWAELRQQGATAATFWYLVAALELLLHTASTLELYSGSVSFKCEGPTPESPIEVTAPVQYSLLEVAGQAFTLLLLCASLWLNSRAEWRTCCSCDAQSLRDAFGESRLCRPLICPRSKHPMLSQVYGKELLLVCSPSGERPLTDPDRWGQDSDSLQLQFQDFAEPATLPARRRTSLLVVGGLGIVLLHGASTSCWGCVDGVTLGRSGGLFDVEAQLLLLGSCGRHNGSGIPCVLAACCMAVLLLAQTVILAAAGKRDGLQDDDQMAITLMDFREYQDNLLYGVLADQEVRSHVWLRPEGDAWDFADFLEESTEASRSSWRRSQGVVGGIRVIREPSEDIWRSVHCKGLPTDEGPSTVYIEFQRPGQPDEAVAPLLRQIVPVDFLPGAFVCSLSVGRRQAWNNLSLTLSGAAMALILFDLGFHLEYSLQGTILKDCEDVLSGRCLELEPRDRINVRSAFGVYLALLGAACAEVFKTSLLEMSPTAYVEQALEGETFVEPTAMTASQGVSQEAAIAVLAILGARDHYAAIDAPRDASVAELRRCYLKASILVHPDKNCHPDSTRAFQRVAAAWATLSDEDKRRAYDRELLEGDQSDDIHMTPEEAFAAFAFAAACAASGTGGAGAAFGDMAETLLWAQQLGQMNSCGQGLAMPVPGFGFPSSPYASCAAPAAGSVAASFGGIALSVGLWSAGLAISIVGLPRIGGFARRLALLQGISQVVIASQVPAVRSAACAAASLGAARVQQAAGDFADQHPRISNIASKVKARSFEAADSLRHMVDNHISIDMVGAAEKVKARGGAAVKQVRRLVDHSCGASDLWAGQSCLGWNAQESDSEEEDTWYVQNMRLRRQRAWKPRAGTWVKLSNLQRARHLEGSLGEVLAFDRDSGRYLVQLIAPQNAPIFHGGCPEPPIVSKLVLLQNLRPAFDRSSKPPGSEAHFIFLTSFTSHTVPMGSESDSAAESQLPAVRGPRASREALLADSDESPKANPQNASALLRAVEKPGAEDHRSSIGTAKNGMLEVDPPGWGSVRSRRTGSDLQLAGQDEVASELRAQRLDIEQLQRHSLALQEEMDQQKQVVKWLMLSNDQLLAVVEEQRALIEHLRWETRPSGPRMAPPSLGDISESQEALKDCSNTWTSTLQQREDASQPVAFAASQGQQASSPEGASSVLRATQGGALEELPTKPLRTGVRSGLASKSKGAS